MKLSKTLKARITEHLNDADCVNPSTKGGGGKCDKRRRNRPQSRTYRFARTKARKDQNVERSSHGHFTSVADLVAGKWGVSFTKENA